MRKKLKECQGQRVISYQHLGEYLEGDKEWYQPKNGNIWFGPAAVLRQCRASVWLHSKGDIKKVAACCVNPYEFMERDMNNDNEEVSLSNYLKLEKAVQRMEDKSNDLKTQKAVHKNKQLMLNKGLADVVALYAGVEWRFTKLLSLDPG